MVCKITVTAKVSSISVNNDDNPSNPTNTYFTVLVQANAAMSGLEGLYEAVINANTDGTGGSVLNTGRTLYNLPVKVVGDSYLLRSIVN